MPLKTSTRLATVIYTKNQPIEIFNIDISTASSASSLTGILYHEVASNFTITKAEIQLFNKGSVSSGTLSIDVKKGETADDLVMDSIFTTLPSLDLSTSSDYSSNTGILNSSQTSVTVGQMLRLDITNIPTGLGNFRVVLKGEQ